MISIITPLLNEEENIRPFLAHLGTLKGDFELILVDGGSSDGTLWEVEQYAEGFGRSLTVLTSGRGRALQMNRGGDEAQGDLLLFLHVDCFLESDALVCIEKEMSKKTAIGGGFRQSFTESDVFLKLVSLFGNMRARLTKTFYGDYGIFLRRDSFHEMGGYPSLPFLEDVEICRKARKYGRLIQIDRTILTSPRRYLKKGRMRLTAAFVLAVVLNAAGFRPRFFMKYLIDT